MKAGIMSPRSRHRFVSLLLGLGIEVGDVNDVLGLSSDLGKTIVSEGTGTDPTNVVKSRNGTTNFDIFEMQK